LSSALGAGDHSTRKIFLLAMEKEKLFQCQLKNEESSYLHQRQNL